MGLKKIAPAVAALLAAAFMCGCGKEAEIPEISLSLWGNENNSELLKEMVDDFNNEHKKEVKINCTVSVQGETSCKDIVLLNPENAADIFAFADDQISDLMDAGALLQITDNPDEVIKNSGGTDAAVCQLVTHDSKVYAYPQTAGNGYFLYYNKKYFSEDDIGSFDRLISTAEKNGKLFSMELTSGWYLYSFFNAAGLELSLNEDKTSNVCNWNATDTRHTGAQITEYLLGCSKRKGFTVLSDADFVNGVKDGSVIAGINGPWNSDAVLSEWGDDFGAAKMPSYTLNGDTLQMSSFCGYKLVGINSHTTEPEWCMKLASYITNEENQLKLFRVTGECPVNINARVSDEVQSSPVVAALAAQSEFSTVQNIASPFWEPSNRFGITVSGGNLGNRDIQEMLDEMVMEITS